MRRRVLDVDLYGVRHGMRAAYPIMARQGFGHIVNTSSAGAFFPAPGNAPYCTAKHTLVGLSLSLRLEDADLGVKVSSVCAGFVRTNIYQNAQVAGMTLPAGVPREQLAGAPAKMMPSARAAQIILDGVGAQQGTDHLPRQHPLGPARQPPALGCGRSDVCMFRVVWWLVGGQGQQVVISVRGWVGRCSERAGGEQHERGQVP